MNAISLAVVILVLCYCSTIDAIKWINCPGATLKGKVSNVAVVGCETATVCPLIKGKNATIEIDFASDEDSKEATSVVHGIIAGVPFPFTPPNPNVCKDSGVACPIKTSTSYVYKTNIFVRPEYPSVQLKVKWEIQDSDGNDIVCVEIPVKISPGANSVNNRLLFAPRQRL